MRYYPLNLSHRKKLREQSLSSLRIPEPATVEICIFFAAGHNIARSFLFVANQSKQGRTMSIESMTSEPNFVVLDDDGKVITESNIPSFQRGRRTPTKSEICLPRQDCQRQSLQRQIFSCAFHDRMRSSCQLFLFRFSIPVTFFGQTALWALFIFINSV